MEKEKLTACVSYMKSNPVFLRILKGFAEKYQGLGHIGGQVKLTISKQENIDILEGFFQKNYHGRKSVTISAVNFQKAIDNSCYCGITIIDLLEVIYADKMYIKKDERVKKQLEEESDLNTLIQLCKKTEVLHWLKQIVTTKEMPYLLLVKKYREDKQKFLKDMELLIQALEQLPVYEDKFIYLPIFAAKITGNPHAFDEGGEFSSLLNYGITGVLSIPFAGNATIHAGKRQELYYQAGILIDDISNYTTIYGMLALDRDKKLHLGVEGFYHKKQPLQLPLTVVAQLAEIHCREHCLYAVENPSIFSTLIADEKAEISLICTNGQPRLASLLILDLAVQSGNMIYYAGDFDPEGLLIAQRLKERYRENLVFWHMTVADYQLASYTKKSDTKESEIQEGNHLSERRLRLLDKITAEELVDLAEAIKNNKTPVYQEQILAVYRIGNL